MVCYYNQYHDESTILWISPLVYSKGGVDFAMLFTLRESRYSNIPIFQYCMAFDYGNIYLRNTIAPAVKPDPKASVRTVCPSRMRPSRIASSSAVGIVAAEVLP